MSNQIITDIENDLEWVETKAISIINKVENSSTAQALEAKAKTLWAEFEPMEESVFTSAVGAGATAALNLASGNSAAGFGELIEATVSGLEASFVANQKVVSKQAVSLLATTVLNSVSSKLPAAQ